ncbi:MAG: alpha/beta hydrolase [Acidimicrobiales bacterium]
MALFVVVALGLTGLFAVRPGLGDPVAPVGVSLVASRTPIGTSPVGSTALAPPAPECVPRSTPVPKGPATQVSSAVVPGSNGRVHDIVLQSPAMGGPVHVDILLPAGYHPGGSVHYPVLYLLHGAGGSYQDWVDHGVQHLIGQVSAADHIGPFITVMPNDGPWGFYTNWYGTNRFGTGSSAPPPAWSTFDIRELIPWVDAHFPVIAHRWGRAIAGLSMGGFGAMSYAARYPGMFVAAGSFSGAVDIDLDYPAGPEGLTAASMPLGGGQFDQCIWGDPLTQDVLWRGADPTSLAPNLSNTSLFVASGNGLPGPYDSPSNPSTGEDGAIEGAISLMNQGFTRALDSAHVPYTGYFYGPGTHSWPYWLRDLAHFLPQMSAAMTDPRPAPPEAPFNFCSIAGSFTAWGWSFTTDHLVTEFTYLRGVTPAGMEVAGSGRMVVHTPALYRPELRYQVRSAPLRGLPSVPDSTQVVRASPSGTLEFTIDLGHRHRVQQVQFGPAATATWVHTAVSIVRYRA